MSIRKKSVLDGLILFILLAAFTLSILSQPARDRVLEDVTIHHDDGHHVIEIQFPFRVRYQSHFPPRSGSELRIRLQPVSVATADIDAVFKRESVVPRYADVVALDEVIYEGDIDTGAQLTLLFSDRVTYEVIPDPDYTHIRVVVLGIE